MIFTIVIPDIDWLVRLVRDFFQLVRQAYPEIKTAEIKLVEDTNVETS